MKKTTVMSLLMITALAVSACGANTNTASETAAITTEAENTVRWASRLRAVREHRTAPVVTALPEALADPEK